MGLVPVAPGTCGSLAGLVVLWPALGWPLWWQWTLWGVVVAVAIWSADRAGRSWGVIDHPAIVIDEVAGLALTLLIPLSVVPVAHHEGLLLLIGLLMFRGYDIVKPWPVAWCERRVPGGFGVVLDDLVAGLMGGLCVSVLMLAIAR